MQVALIQSHVLPLRSGEWQKVKMLNLLSMLPSFTAMMLYRVRSLLPLALCLICMIAVGPTSFEPAMLTTTHQSFCGPSVSGSVRPTCAACCLTTALEQDTNLVYELGHMKLIKLLRHTHLSRCRQIRGHDSTQAQQSAAAGSAVGSALGRSIPAGVCIPRHIWRIAGRRCIRHRFMAVAPTSGLGVNRTTSAVCRPATGGIVSFGAPAATGTLFVAMIVECFE